MEEKAEALTREELSQAIVYKIKICKKYAMKAINKATEGNIEDALSLYNIARTAHYTAMQEQNQLLRMCKGSPNKEEVKLFKEVTTLHDDVIKAYLAIRKNKQMEYQGQKYN